MKLQAFWDPDTSTLVRRQSNTWVPIAGGGGGDDITVNAAPVVGANFNDTTPAAVANALNVKWQITPGVPADVSAYVKVDGTELVVIAGALQVGVISMASVTGLVTLLSLLTSPFRENTVLSTDYTLAASRTDIAVDNVTIAAGVTLTLGAGSYLRIL